MRQSDLVEVGGSAAEVVNRLVSSLGQSRPSLCREITHHHVCQILDHLSGDGEEAVAQLVDIGVETGGVDDVHTKHLLSSLAP